MTAIFKAPRPLITEKEVGTWLGVSVKWVQKNRYGPAPGRIPFVKYGHGVRYDPVDVEEWLKGRRK